MKSLRAFTGVALVLAFSACSDVILKPSSEVYQVVLQPAQLGYEVKDGTIVVVGNQAYVQVSPGAPEGYLERYEYTVVDDTGNEVFPGGSLGSGFVGINVPPGWEKTPDGDFVYRTMRSEFFTFSLDGKVAREHLVQGAPLNWRYQVTWYVRTSHGRTVSWVQEYQIKYPLKEQ